MVTDWTFLAFASFVLGVLSIGLMLLLHQKQKEQSNEIQKATDKQLKLIDDTKDVYAAGIVGYVQLISDSYGHVIDLYTNKYQNGVFSPQNANVRKMLDNYYDRHLFHLPSIEAMEIVKVFGKTIADKHWRLTAKLQANMWQTYSDHGMALLMYSYKEQMKKLVELKDMFLPFCDKEMKERDEQFQVNYDLIEKEFDNAIKPKKEDYSNEFSSE